MFEDPEEYILKVLLTMQNFPQNHADSIDIGFLANSLFDKYFRCQPFRCSSWIRLIHQYTTVISITTGKIKSTGRNAPDVIMQYKPRNYTQHTQRICSGSESTMAQS